MAVEKVHDAVGGDIGGYINYLDILYTIVGSSTKISWLARFVLHMDFPSPFLHEWLNLG
jgi:hypothetical protein